MNTIDSVEANEELVCIWNHIEEKAKDQEVIDYAKEKRKKLIELRELIRDETKRRKEFDKEYARLIELEIKEVKNFE